jgi:hypothetical protein
MTAALRDVAISAVPFDSILVAELVDQLTPRVRVAPSPALIDDEEPAATKRLTDAESRVVLVLHQRLWGKEPATRADATAIRARLAHRHASVLVLRVDDSAVPSWLAKAPKCELRSAGIDAAIDAVVAAVKSAGGSPKAAPAREAAVVPERARAFETPPAFLSQGRAFSVLRRELDALCSELEPRLEAEEARCADRSTEVHALPNRVVARMGDVGVSFSWVSGRQGTVADGRLMVIEWSGVESVGRGTGAMHAATPTREVVYQAECTGPDSWRWRSDDQHGRARSTANLVAEWITGASIALEQSSSAA